MSAPFLHHPPLGFPMTPSVGLFRFSLHSLSLSLYLQVSLFCFVFCFVFWFFVFIANAVDFLLHSALWLYLILIVLVSYGVFSASSPKFAYFFIVNPPPRLGLSYISQSFSAALQSISWLLMHLGKEMGREDVTLSS